MNDVFGIRVAIRDVQRAMRDIKRVRDAIKASERDEEGGLRRRSALARSHASAVDRIGGSYHRLRSTILATTAAATALFGAGSIIRDSVDKFEQARGFARAVDFSAGRQNREQLNRDGRQLADLVGVRFADLRQSIVGMVGAGVKPGSVTKDLRAFMALGAAGGATGEQISRALIQFQQIASQGKLQGDELRSIQENMVPLLKLMRDAGLGPRIGSQTNPITFAEIEKILQKFGERADVQKMLRERGEMPSAGLARIQTVIDDLQAALGEGLAPTIVDVSKRILAHAKAIDPARVKKTVEEWIEKAKEWYRWIKANADTLRRIGEVLIGLYVALRAYQIGRQIGEAIGGIVRVVRGIKQVGTDAALGDLAAAATAAAGALWRLAGAATAAAGGAAVAGGGSAIVPAIAGGGAAGAARLGGTALIYSRILSLLAMGGTVGEAVATTGVGGTAALAAVVAAISYGIGVLIRDYIIKPLGGYDWTQRMIDEYQKTRGAYGKGAATLDEINRMRVSQGRAPMGHLPTTQKSAPAVSQRRSDPQRMMTEAAGNGMRAAAGAV